MPHITKGQRGRYDHAIMLLMKDLEGAPDGDVNYVITQIIRKRVGPKRLHTYKKLQDIVGLLDCVLDEFKRLVLHPYKDKKRMENGDVYEEK